MRAPEEFIDDCFQLQPWYCFKTTQLKARLYSNRVGSLSRLQELLGHCLALYQANRQLACKLEDHLEQYGYTKPSSREEEPEDPCSSVTLSEYGELAL